MMGLSEFHVLHIPKAGQTSVLEPRVALPAHTFMLDTCQRKIWAFWSLGESGYASAASGRGELLSGSAAYEFFLRVACGLESKVLGETDIFGQLKSSWANHEAKMAQIAEMQIWSESERHHSKQLRNTVQRIFEDTKEIRSSHLQNVGASSYGSLVRKLLRQNRMEKSQPALLVGGGQLAVSVAPWLVEGRSLWVLNRSKQGLEAVRAELEIKAPGAQIEYFSTEEMTSEQESELWKKAAYAVVCIPSQTEEDAQRIQWWREGNLKKRMLIHLGGFRAACDGWEKLDQFFALDDLFAAFQGEDGKRMRRFERASRACEEKATLRLLSGDAGGPINLPHGWEDLALFA